MSRELPLSEYGEIKSSLEGYIFAQGGDNAEERTYIKQIMLRAVENELDARQAEILRRHYFDGESLSDIARRLGVNKSTVSRSVNRSVKKLRQALKYALYALRLVLEE